MSTFALVHGGFHGAWCWEQLSPLLQKDGHRVVTMELPLEDSAATFDTYADVVCAALEDSDDDVVLVGHSYGGNTIPHADPCDISSHDVFYFDCDEQTAEAALGRLRPQSVNPAVFPFSLAEHPRVPTT